MLRVQLDGPRVIANGLFILFEPSVSTAPVVPRIRVFRFQLDDLRVIVNGLFILMSLEISIGPLPPGPSVLGIQLQRPGVLRNRLLPRTLFLQKLGHGAVSCRVSRTEHDGRRVIAQAIVIAGWPAGIDAEPAQGVVEPKIVRVLPMRFAENGHGLVQRPKSLKA